MTDEDFGRYADEVITVTEVLPGDPWPADVGVVSDPRGIISAEDRYVVMYLATISMLWQLGVKEIQ